MDNIEAAHIAYSCVQAHFGISAKNRWGETDGPFSYCIFYYTVMEEIEDSIDLEWKVNLLKHYNMLLFKDKNGRRSHSKEKLDNVKSTTGGSSSTFLTRMRAQAAARASRVSSTLVMDHTGPTSPDRAPQVITPPPTSPPRNMSPDLTVPVAGPSKQAVLIDSKLSELEDDALVDISNAKSGSSAKIAKKKATTKNGKMRAVLSEDEDALVTVEPQTQCKSGHKNRRK
ncbi:hypothetical protein PAXINDRAFT_6930 [Paxillus involutus ATCC 200175]|nr:hypothetical protein PAXINDRAFT_6930 [Paxillus involutus ATCC 200175]